MIETRSKTGKEVIMQKTMSIIVPTELLDGLTEIAKREDRTVSSLVRVALRGFIERARSTEHESRDVP